MCDLEPFSEIRSHILVTKQQHRIGVNTSDIHFNLLFLEHSCSCYTSTHIQYDYLPIKNHIKFCKNTSPV